MILAATRRLKVGGHVRSITRADLVTYRTELVVMSWNVVRSRRLITYGMIRYGCARSVRLNAKCNSMTK